jgi:hypothetical protein
MAPAVVLPEEGRRALHASSNRRDLGQRGPSTTMLMLVSVLNSVSVTMACAAAAVQTGCFQAAGLHNAPRQIQRY